MRWLKTGIYVFADVEVLDFCGPFEVFSVTRQDGANRREEPSPFDVFLVAEGPGPVVTTGGMKVMPDHTLESCPPLDILVVPGGWGTRAEIKNARLLAWIASRAGFSRVAPNTSKGPQKSSTSTSSNTRTPVVSRVTVPPPVV